MRRLLLAAAGLCAAPAPGLRAEPVPAPAEADDSLPTVIVTSRLVVEAADAVPISLVVVDGQDLADARLVDIVDLPQRVSGLTVSASNPRLTSLSLRGLGSSTQNDGLESSVGLFLDGVYLGRSSFAAFDLVDLDRIEVLRGPQGTLLGKNTTAGAIHLHTQLPSHEASARVEASGGEFGTRELRATATGPLQDQVLAGRLTVNLARRDGLLRNRFDGGRLNDRDRAGARGQLLWTPSDDLAARLIAEVGRLDERCCAYPLVAPLRESVQRSDAYMEYTRASTDAADRQADSDAPTTIEVDQQGLSAELVHTDPHDRQWTSLSAFRRWNFEPLNDDATSLRLVTGGLGNTHAQYTQEFRLNAPVGEAEMVAGLFLFHQHVRGVEDGRLGDELASWVFGGLLREQVPTATRSNSGLLIDTLIPPRTLDGMLVRTRYTQDTEGAAAYASMGWPLAGRLRLDAGLRYTHEWKQAQVRRTRTGGDPNASPLSLADGLGPLGALLGLDLAELTFGGLLDSVAGGEFSRDDHRQEGRLSGSLALGWEATPQLNVYGSVASGYKSGGINLGVTSEAISPTFRPETALALEIGAKHRSAGGRRSLAVAAYRTRVDDYQALTFDEDPTIIPNPRQTNLLNVGRVELYGIEAEGAALLGRGLRLRTGVSWNHAETVDFRNAPDQDTRRNTRDLSGKRLYNAPAWTVNGGVEWRHPLGRVEAFIAADHAYRTRAYATVERGRASLIQGYHLTQLRLGLGEPSQGWEAWLWVRNVFDTDYIAAVQAVYGVGDYGAFAGEPRIAGVSLRGSF